MGRAVAARRSATWSSSPRPGGSGSRRRSHAAHSDGRSTPRSGSPSTCGAGPRSSDRRRSQRPPRAAAGGSASCPTRTCRTILGELDLPPHVEPLSFAGTTSRRSTRAARCSSPTTRRSRSTPRTSIDRSSTSSSTARRCSAARTSAGRATSTTSATGSDRSSSDVSGRRAGDRRRRSTRAATRHRVPGAHRLDLRRPRRPRLRPGRGRHRGAQPAVRAPRGLGSMRPLVTVVDPGPQSRPVHRAVHPLAPAAVAAAGPVRGRLRRRRLDRRHGRAARPARAGAAARPRDPHPGIRCPGPAAQHRARDGARRVRAVPRRRRRARADGAPAAAQDGPGEPVGHRPRQVRERDDGAAPGPVHPHPGGDDPRGDPAARRRQHGPDQALPGGAPAPSTRSRSPRAGGRWRTSCSRCGRTWPPA